MSAATRAALPSVKSREKRAPAWTAAPSQPAWSGAIGEGFDVMLFCMAQTLAVLAGANNRVSHAMARRGMSENDGRKTPGLRRVTSWVGDSQSLVSGISTRILEGITSLSREGSGAISEVVLVGS